MEGDVTRKPIHVETRATVAFIAGNVPPQATILEVGCGAGHVAVELLSRGFQVIGVDAEEEMVARARERGAPVVHASWPAFTSAPVDAVVFTRSLHHIHPLQGAIRKSREVLRPAGALLLEDFAFDGADRLTITWFLRILDSKPGRELIAPIPGEFVTKLLDSKDPVAEWHQSHDPGLHTAAAMTRAIAECFSIRYTQSVPYLYRYLVPVLPETAEAAVFVDEVFQNEARLGELGELTLIGRRIVGSPLQGDAAEPLLGTDGASRVAAQAER
jgi:SAM-dependent methyltransferase